MEDVGVGEAAGLERDVGHRLDSVVDDGCQLGLGQEPVEPDLRCAGSLLGAFDLGFLGSPAIVERARLGGRARVLCAAALARFY